MKDRWEDNSPWMQARIIGYHQRAIYEENQANTPKRSPGPPPRPKGGGGRRGKR